MNEFCTALAHSTTQNPTDNLTAEQEARLRENLKAQEALPEGRDFARGVALDAEFHMMFCEFLGNREILNVMGQLREKIARVIAQVFQINPGRVRTSYD